MWPRSTCSTSLPPMTTIPRRCSLRVSATLTMWALVQRWWSDHEAGPAHGGLDLLCRCDDRWIRHLDAFVHCAPDLQGVGTLCCRVRKAVRHFIRRCRIGRHSHGFCCGSLGTQEVTADSADNFGCLHARVCRRRERFAVDVVPGDIRLWAWWSHTRNLGSNSSAREG